MPFHIGDEPLSKITIEWLSDSHECETCGHSYADGARISIDGAVALELVPLAACFDGDHFSEEEVYKRIIAHLGHELELVE